MFIQTGFSHLMITCLFTVSEDEPGGFAAISRWLSPRQWATPPEMSERSIRTPAGCQKVPFAYWTEHYLLFVCPHSRTGFNLVSALDDWK